MFPTCVGMNRYDTDRCEKLGDVPHVCGDEPYQADADL